MKTMKTIARLCTLAAAALLLLPTGIAAQNAAVRKIMQTAREDNRAMHHLDILCNRFGGRITGSDAQENALKWASRCFEQWGYEVEMEQVGILATGFNRGGWWGRMTGDEQMTLNFVTPSYTAGTKGLQRGHVVIEPTTQAEFDRIKGRLRGAWVLLNGRFHGYAISDSPDAKEYRRKTIIQNAENERYNREHAGEDGEKRHISDSPGLFYDEMAKAGILGVIQASEVPMQALYNIYVIDEKVPFDSLPTLPDIRLDEEQYNRIRTLVQQRRNVELEFDIRNHFRLGPIPYHNLVATLKGSKHPDEYVVVGAHIDSFDSATGGVDCGSGVSAVMEAARMIATSGAKPDRTIIFILFTAEEFGLWGSQAWVKAHPDMVPRISNMFNRDGGPMPYVGFAAPPSLKGEYEKIAAQIRELYPDYPFEVRDLKPRQKPNYGGNDASVFGHAGVPVLQMDERDVKGYNFSYGEIWHTDRDRYDKSIPEYQQQAAGALALMVLGTANLPSRSRSRSPHRRIYDTAHKRRHDPPAGSRAAIFLPSKASGHVHFPR